MTPELVFALFIMPVLVVGLGHVAMRWQERETRRFDEQHRNAAE